MSEATHLECPNCHKKTLPFLRATILSLVGRRLTCTSCGEQCQHSRGLMTLLTIFDVLLLAFSVAFSIDKQTQLLKSPFHIPVAFIFVVALNILVIRLIPLRKLSSKILQSSSYWLFVILIVAIVIMMLAFRLFS